MLQILKLARETRDRQFATIVAQKQPFQAEIALTGNCCSILVAKHPWQSIWVAAKLRA